jgi:hypothetical protein
MSQAFISAVDERGLGSPGTASPALSELALGADHGRQLRPEDLDGDVAVVLEVLCQEYGGHAALPELTLDAVAVLHPSGQGRRDGCDGWGRG